jgi:hypothetical protein
VSRLPEVYPDAPGHKTTGTSMEAALAVANRAKTLRAKVLATLQGATTGLSADAIADVLGESVLSIRPRVSELHRAGEIRKTEARVKNASGMNAVVWVVSPPLPGPSIEEVTNG